jgi:hypothetical protein
LLLSFYEQKEEEKEKRKAFASVELLTGLRYTKYI